MPPINPRNVRPRDNALPTRRSERILERATAATVAAAQADRAATVAAARADRAATVAAARANRPATLSSQILILENPLPWGALRNRRALQHFFGASDVLDSTPPLTAGGGILASILQPATDAGDATLRPATGADVNAGASTPLEVALPATLSALTRGETGPQASVNSRAEARIKRELLKFQKEQPEGLHVELDDGNLFRWKATIRGPEGTPYEGGVFRLILLFHHNFPFVPPKMCFVNKIYHCNVATTGNICIDILSSEWSPALTVTKVLLSVISLLGDPNPEDPLQPILADLCKRRRDLYDANARLWTQRYAKPEEEGQTEG